MSIVLAEADLSGESQRNYSWLKSSVAEWLHRADLADKISGFIVLAEAKMSSDITSRSMDCREILHVEAGDEYAILPADMMEMRRLMLLTNPRQALKYATPDQIAADYPLGTTGKPLVFSVIGGELQLAPIPDAGYDLELTYRKRIPALSASNPANWLLSKWPNAYLYATLCAAQPYIMNDARLVTFQALYKEAISGINSVDWFSGSTLQVRAR